MSSDRTSLWRLVAFQHLTSDMNNLLCSKRSPCGQLVNALRPRWPFRQMDIYIKVKQMVNRRSLVIDAVEIVPSTGVSSCQHVSPCVTVSKIVSVSKYVTMFHRVLSCHSMSTCVIESPCGNVCQAVDQSWKLSLFTKSSKGSLAYWPLWQQCTSILT